MIQIAEPRQIRVESHRGVVDSNAMTKEAFASGLEDEYRLAPSDIQAGEMEAASPLVAPPQVEESSNSDRAFFENPYNAPPLSDAKLKAAQPALPPGAIQKLAVQRSAKSRQLLMVAVLGSSGVLIAGLLFTAFMFWYSSDKAKPPVAVNPPNDRTTPGPKLESNSGAASETDALSDPASDLVNDPLAEQPASPVPSSLNGQSLPTDNDKAGDKTTSESAKSKAAESGTDLASALTQAMSSEAEGRDANPSAPTGSEQSRATKKGDPNQPPANDVAVDATATPAAARAELPEQLKKFENILNRTIEPQMIVDEVIQKAPPTAEELGLQTGVDSRALPAVDVGAQLQLDLSGLVIPSATPFSVAVGTWVQVSGVPTGVDLDSFAAAGIDPFQTVGLKEASTQSVGDVGKKVAEAINVNLVDIGNRFLVFQASEQAVREKLGTAIKVNDLVTDEAQEKWLVSTLDQLLPQAASTENESHWKIVEGELVIDPAKVDSLSWFWAVRLLESWRSAAKLETKLNGLAQDKFVTQFVDPEQLEHFDKPMVFSQLERTAVPQLIATITSENKVHAWVDWAATSQRGLGPGTVDVIVTYRRTLRQALRDLINKYGVVIAFENDRSLLITTTHEYLAQPRLYVLPSEGKTAEQWMEELEPLTPSTPDAVQPVRAILTPDSQFVIVRCCRPRLRG